MNNANKAQVRRIQKQAAYLRQCGNSTPISDKVASGIGKWLIESGSNYSSNKLQEKVTDNKEKQNEQ